MTKKVLVAKYDKKENLETIMEYLKDYWIGNFKILANFTRFDRCEVGSHPSVRKTVWKVHANPSRAGVSYEDTVRSDKEIEAEKVSLGNEDARDDYENRPRSERRVEPSSGFRKDGEIKEVFKDAREGKSAIFLPEKEAVAWAKKRLICGLKDGVRVSDAVELLHSKNYRGTII